MTSKPLVRRTFATLRSAEFGFFGVVVYTRVQTPRRKGFDWRAGDFSFLTTSRRLRRTSWLIVGIYLGWVLPPPHQGPRGVRKKSRTGLAGGTEPWKVKLPDTWVNWLGFQDLESSRIADCHE